MRVKPIECKHIKWKDVKETKKGQTGGVEEDQVDGAKEKHCRPDRLPVLINDLLVPCI